MIPLDLLESSDTSSLLISTDLCESKLSNNPCKIEKNPKEHIISENRVNTVISDPLKTSKYIKPLNLPKAKEDMTEHIIPQKDLVELENIKENIKEKIILKNLNKKNTNLYKNSTVNLDNRGSLYNNPSQSIEMKDIVIKNDNNINSLDNGNLSKLIDMKDIMIKNDNNINLLDYDFINDTINIEKVYQESSSPSSLLTPTDLCASKLSCYPIGL
jgi:hypothetical protein